MKKANTTSEIRTKGYSSESEKERRKEFFTLYKQCPIPDREILSNLGLFINRRDLSRMLFLNEIYQHIVDIHGIVIEFGVRWGQSLALFESFRGIYEPFNHNRKIIGFDTFEGFPSVHKKDGTSEIVKKGSYSVTSGYENYLEEVLDYHENESPIGHMKKYQLIKGDATKQIDIFLENNPETIIAFAYFDLDLYEPTKKCLESISPYLTKGSVIGFDQLNLHDFPGETIALREAFGLNRYKIKRSRFSSGQSYILIE